MYVILMCCDFAHITSRDTILSIKANTYIAKALMRLWLLSSRNCYDAAQIIVVIILRLNLYVMCTYQNQLIEFFLFKSGIFHR